MYFFRHFHPIRGIESWTYHIHHGDFGWIRASLGFAFIIPLIVALYRENVFNRKK